MRKPRPISNIPPEWLVTQLEFTLLAVCEGYFAIGPCLRSCRSDLIEQGLSEHTARQKGVQYFILPAKTEWKGPLRVKYPHGAKFRLTKLGTL